MAYEVGSRVGCAGVCGRGATSRARSSSDPKASSSPPWRCREGRHQHISVVVSEVAVGQNNLKLCVEREKRLQEVLLAPEPELLLDPALRILEREVDVVDVDDDALVEQREQLEVEEIHVPSAPNDVRGVD